MATDLVIILSSDWVGSTATRAQLGEEPADALQEVHDTLLRRVIAAEGGTVVKHYGDGVLATFNSATAALSAAVKIQQDFAASRASPDALARMDLRIGLAAGDIKHQAGDIFGLPVVEAVRLQGAAAPNEILCSDLVRVLSQGRGGFEFEAAGGLEFKGLPAPVPALKVRRPDTPAPRPSTPIPARPVPRRTLPALIAVSVLVVIAVLGYVASRDSAREEQAGLPMTPPADKTILESPAPAAPARLSNSVAVLPFENLSPDSDNAYFAAGLHEEILNQLAKIKALNVIARTTMRQYANTDKSLRQVADELNVETVMEGSVRYADNHVRVTTQLIDPATGSHLWSETYDHEFKDIFTIESDIAMNVANALEAEFTEDEQTAIEREPTVSPEAYALYLSASAYNSQQTAEAMTLGLERIDHALELAPEFAAGWVLKAWLHNIGRFIYLGQANEHAGATERAARRALALDPNQGDAHSILTVMLGGSGEWLPAAEEERLAVALGGIGVYDLYSATGHIKEAYNKATRATQTDPLHSTHFMFRFALTDIIGETEVALRLYERGTTLFEVWPGGHFNALVILLGRGKPERAEALMRARLSNIPIVIDMLELFNTPPAALAKLNTLYSDPAYATHIGQLWIAAFAAYFHDPQLALQAMRKSTDTLASNAYLFWTPLFREVRLLDEFKDYLREKGFVAYWRQYGWPDLCKPAGADDFECS